jgi:hypothetical protein
MFIAGRANSLEAGAEPRDGIMERTTTEKAVIEAVAQKERRRSRRAKIARPMLASPSDPRSKHREEVQSSVNASRDGLYFTTRATHYHLGMHLNVTLGYAPNDPCNQASLGEVVRIDRLDDDRFGIAVKIHLP